MAFEHRHTHTHSQYTQAALRRIALYYIYILLYAFLFFHIHIKSVLCARLTTVCGSAFQVFSLSLAQQFAAYDYWGLHFITRVPDNRLWHVCVCVSVCFFVCVHLLYSSIVNVASKKKSCRTVVYCIAFLKPLHQATHCPIVSHVYVALSLALWYAMMHICMRFFLSSHHHLASSLVRSPSLRIPQNVYVYVCKCKPSNAGCTRTDKFAQILLVCVCVCCKMWSTGS